jgi:nucleotide-binding universal stress UspA family protein
MKASPIPSGREMSESGDGQHRIVVGVDGSQSSKHALLWAARQAGFTSATLEVVTGWEYPAFFGFAPSIPGGVDYGELAGGALDQSIDEVFGDDRPTRLETRVVAMHPALALVEASEGAELLVVGSRGYGGLADALLGSVSTYCIHHAHCPVTVIRPADHDRK